ncbi:hypothetical protein MLD38_030177 [Melastoma candidum]|uniref:Uncharacterized protein n=1 Tax=Melastoma candidum TaxID=119954 RepID=A0ACB9MKH9_9MYRT|nr:hypothetical protein MLD38_030177 [Melastoma candidum]
MGPVAGPLDLCAQCCDLLTPDVSQRLPLPGQQWLHTVSHPREVLFPAAQREPSPGTFRYHVKCLGEKEGDKLFVIPSAFRCEDRAFLCRLEKLGGLRRKLVVEDNKGWRLISCIWLHAGVVHLATSMLSLMVVGNGLERELGFCKNQKKLQYKTGTYLSSSDILMRLFLNFICCIIQ